MTESIEDADGVVRVWDLPSRSVHDLSNLKKVLSRYVREVDEMDEVRVEGDRPVVVQRTEEDDMIIEVSATYKPTSYHRIDTGGNLGEDRIEEVLRIFDEIESPAATTEELAERLGWSPSTIERRLIELEHRGALDHNQSGHTTLWWVTDTNSESDGIESSSTVPDFVKEGLEKSRRDIDQWLRDRQKNDESIEETYDRVRGSPEPDDIRDFVSDSEFDMDEFRDSISSASDDEKKDSLKNMFK